MPTQSCVTPEGLPPSGYVQSVNEGVLLRNRGERQVSGAFLGTQHESVAHEKGYLAEEETDMRKINNIGETNAFQRKRR
jgi:hypothetical protein